MEKVYVFDTTLRDGEQVPGAKLAAAEKLEIARQLEALGVDVIEAGFPASSPGDFEAVRNIARNVRGVSIAGLARAVPSDIDAVWEAVKEAANPQIHIVLGVSDVHLRGKFHKSREEILRMGVEAVRYARAYTSNVEYSTEDAGRADLDYLCRFVEAVIAAGAKVVNIPDTTGYCYPKEFGHIIRTLMERVPNIHQAIISVHCHNDLGMAVANTLAGVRNGARRVEVCVNGLGERAGNAALEEVVMALKTRADYFGVETGVRTEEIFRTSRLVSTLTGIVVQPNKAIVGANAFAHSSGIHQDGVLKERSTYEIIDPGLVGVAESKLVLTARSGRHALRAKLEKLGYKDFSEGHFQQLYQRFLEVADRKKEVYDEDLEAIISDELRRDEACGYVLEEAAVTCGTKGAATAEVAVRGPEGTVRRAKGGGSGPVDAAYVAVDQIVGIPCKLLEFSLQSVTEGIDALAQVHVRIEAGGKLYAGRAAHSDIVVSGVNAYLDALNKAASKEVPAAVKPAG